MASPDRRIQQATLVQDSHGIRFLARSEGIDPAEIEQVVERFGTKPRTFFCPLAHFACPLGHRKVIIGRIQDRPDGSLGYHLLVMASSLYRFLGDPFAIADRYPNDWSIRGTIPELMWPEEVLPKRNVGELQLIFQTADTTTEEMALLLGSAQVLVDGGNVVIQRDLPAEKFMRSLWQLLPDKARSEIWPASFAFSLELGFHAAIMPELPQTSTRLNHTEDGLKNYPPGSYELSLQCAIEDGDQHTVDQLFARRTIGETMKLGLSIIAFAFLAAGIAKFIL